LRRINIKDKFTNHIGKTLAVIHKTEHINNNPNAINNIIRFSKAIYFAFLSFLTFFAINILIGKDIFRLFSMEISPREENQTR
jgi:hypothetical protein